MKKHISYLVLGVLTITLISELARADTPSNSYLEIIDDYIVPNQLNSTQSECAPYIGSGNLNNAANCIKYGLGPAVDQNHQNIISNYNDIQTNSTDTSTNTSNISTNTSNISTNASAIETLQGSSSSADITANTNKINTNTSNINRLGEGVAGSTALTAALSALPQISKESKTTCGVGTGAYSSRYAVGFGCASKVNERVDINAGGSYVFGGSKSYGGGTLESGVVKAGFVFKLGELNKPTHISFQDKKLIDKKISNLVKDNQNLKEKNDEIITQNQKLLARLEKLENIALKFQSNSEMISVATKD